MIGLILDTSVLIAAERRTLRLEVLLEGAGAEPLGIAAITASELLHGVRRAKDPGVRARRGAFVEALLDVFPVLSFGLPEARRHAELWEDLVGQGTMIGAHDLLIAATALARGEELATLNQRDFQRVPGLHLAAVERFLS